jgi:Domain of unknown function (DUF4062)
MAVRTVFVSSVMSGFEAIRAAAAEGIERLDMHPVIAERTAAAPDSPRRALLDEAGSADVYLLLLGPRYGEAGPSGRSPTEEEYEEAVRRGRPIIVLVQEGELEQAQADFLERIRGSWEVGILYSKFGGEGDVALAVAAALARFERGAVESPERAAEQAEQLARGPARGYYAGGPAARLAMVPLRDAVLLDAVRLEEPDLAEAMMSLARSCGLVGQAAAIEPSVSGEGVALAAAEAGGHGRIEVTIGTDGAIAVAAPVNGGGPFAGSVVDPDRLTSLIGAATAFARSAWERIDREDEVGRVAVALAITGAAMSVFGTVSGNSMSFGHGLPETILVAEDRVGVPRGQLGEDAQARRLLAEVRRVYLDAGAVAEPR